jgi:hypothetical protein
MNHRSREKEFAARLEVLQRNILLRTGVFGFLRALVPAGVVLLLAVWSAGGATGPEGFLAVGLAVSTAAAVLALLWEQVVRPLWRLRKTRQLVHHLETIGDFSNTLVAAEEAVRLPQRWQTEDPVGREMLDRLFKRARQHLDFLTAEKVVRVSHQRTIIVLAVLVCAAWATFLATDADTVRRGALCLLDPWPEGASRYTAGIYPAPGPDHVVAGQDLALAAVDFTTGEGPARCEVRMGQGMWRPLETRAVPVARPAPHLPPPHRRWEAQLPDVQEDVVWRFRRGQVVSEPRRVAVRHHPLLTSLAARVVPPAYTGLSAREVARVPSPLEVPEGAMLELQGRVNHSLLRAELVLSTGDTLALDPQDQLGRDLAVSLIIDEALEFHPVLVDSFGLVNQSPLVTQVVPFPDREPVVRLSRTGDDGMLPLDGEVNLQVEALDDYGLTLLSLETRISAGQSETGADWQDGVFWQGEDHGHAAWETSAGLVSLDILYPEPTEGLLQRTLELAADASALDMVPGDVLELRVRAVDNRQPGPGQVGESRILRLQLPSAAAVLAAQAEASEERQSELEEMRRRGRQLDADLDRLNRELMKNPLPDWARRQEMEAAVKRQQTLQKELSRLADQLQQDLDRLASGQMTSQAMLDKAEELSQLLNQSPEQALQDLLEKLQRAGEEARSHELAEAIKEVSRNQKDMARRLDAALAMLKRMEREQDMEGLAALLEQMIRKQQELADLSRELAQEEEKKQGSAGQDQEQAAQQEAGENPTGENKEDSESEGQQTAGEQSESESAQSDQADGESPESGEQENQDGESAEDEPPSADDLARRQEALAQELKDLQERLEEALEELQQDQADGEQSPADESMQQALEEALDQLQQQQEKGNMEQASEKLAEMDPEAAAQMQQQALRDLGALYHVLLETQEAMQMAMEQNQLSSLRQLAADLLALSTRQEEIAARIPERMRDVRTLDLTRGQHRLQKAAVGVRQRLSLLMDEAPMRIMKLLGKLDNLIELMGTTVQSMEDNRGPSARREALASLAEANRLVIALLTEAQVQSQSSGGGGGSQQQSLAQKLQQMAGEQAKLNGLTEQLREMLANRGLSQEVRSQMQRLGQAQGTLGEELAGMTGEEEDGPRGSDGERLLGDMGELGSQMERLSQEIDDGLVSEETLIRQERILSRLLDARNSVRRRDYTTRRESRTASRLYDAMQGRDDAERLEDGTAEFRRRYQALEKAPLEYRDLVRRYFATLDSLRSGGYSGPEDNGRPEPTGGEDMP